GQKGGRLPDLKLWVKVVFAAYVILTVPVLALFFLLMVARVPRLIIAAWDASVIQLGKFSYAQNSGNFLGMVAPLMQTLILALLLSASVYLLYSVSRTPLSTLWNWSKPTLRRRIAGALVIMGIVVLVSLLWMPYLSFARNPVLAGVQHFEIT